jgi:hypothetical protein
MTGRNCLLAALAAVVVHATPQAVAAADKPVTTRVGNLANKGELARFERRVWQACGHEARIRLERRASDKRPGRVIGQMPPRGTRIGCDEANATLFIAAGPAEARLFVPALLEPAQRRAFARQLTKACGAPVAITEIRRPSFLPPGRFVDQRPEQGMRYSCGDPIEVRLSAGPRGEALAAAPRDTARTSQPAARPVTATTAAAPLPRADPIPAPTAEPAPAPAPVEVETIDPAAIPASPAQAPRLNLLGPSLLLLLGAGLLVALMLRQLTPQRRPKRPAARARPAVQPPAPLAPLLALERGWPSDSAQLLPATRLTSGPPVDALPPVPLLRDLLRPLDPALDWIAETPLNALGGLGSGLVEGAETLGSLRAQFAEALRFALLFELPPLLARAWAQAPELPGLPAGPQRGWSRLAPHMVEIAVTPDLNLTAAGLPVARPPLRIALQLGFGAARLYIRGAALDAFEPGPVHVSARLDWAGQSRPLAVLRPHAHWPGQLAVTPPLQLHALPADRLRAVG